MLKKILKTKFIEIIVDALLRELIKRSDSKIDNKIYNFIRYYLKG